MIDLENLTKTFPGAQTPAVDRLNLHVDRGEDPETVVADWLKAVGITE